MNRGVLLGTAVLAVVSVSTGFAQRGGPDGSAYGWRADYAAAKAEAKRTGKPMMVVFRCVP